MTTRTVQLWSGARLEARERHQPRAVAEEPLPLQTRVLTLAALSLASWLVTLACILGLLQLLP